jgi:hypothetical protein
MPDVSTSRETPALSATGRTLSTTVFAVISAFSVSVAEFVARILTNPERTLEAKLMQLSISLQEDSTAVPSVMSLSE